MDEDLRYGITNKNNIEIRVQKQQAHLSNKVIRSPKMAESPNQVYKPFHYNGRQS